MSINWSFSAQQFLRMIANAGTPIQYLQRITSGSVSGSSGYDYNDVTTYFVTGSANVIIEHLRAQDIPQVAGFFAEDYERIYVDPSQPIELWDQVIIPAGSGIKYLVLPIHEWRMNNILVDKYAMVRRLVPKSKGAY